MDLPWLTILALLPAVGAVVVVITGPRLAKQIALAASLLTALVAIIVALRLLARRRDAVRSSRCPGSSRSAPTTPSVWTGSG